MVKYVTLLSRCWFTGLVFRSLQWRLSFHEIEHIINAQHKQPLY